MQHPVKLSSVFWLEKKTNEGTLNKQFHCNSVLYCFFFRIFFFVALCHFLVLCSLASMRLHHGMKSNVSPSNSYQSRVDWGGKKVVLDIIDIHEAHSRSMLCDDGEREFGESRKRLSVHPWCCEFYFFAFKSVFLQPFLGSCFFVLFSEKSSGDCSKANCGKLLDCWRLLFAQATVPGPMRWVGFSIVVLRSTHWSGGPLMSDRSCNTLLLYCCCYYCYTLFETGLIGQAYMCQCGSHTRVVKATAQRVMLLKQQESAEWAGILAPNSPAPSCSQLMTISLFMWVWCLCAGLQLNATLSSLKT